MEAAEATQLVDCVVNRTLIPKNLNVTVGKRPPQTYLNDLKKLNPSLEVSLQDHLVPPEIVTDISWNHSFRRFLDMRASLILGHIQRYVNDSAKEMEARYAAAPEGAESSGSDHGGRLARGVRTPESAFVVPILKSLQDLGGQAPMNQVLGIVGSILKDQLQDVDYNSLPSEPGKSRWSNTAQSARNSMVSRGLLKNDSPRGIWEISPQGVQFLRNEQPAETTRPDCD